MSVVCAVRLVRDRVGEVAATLGVEFQAVPPAVLPEFVRYQVRAHDEVALPAHLAFALLGCDPPLGVGPMQPGLVVDEARGALSCEGVSR